MSSPMTTEPGLFPPELAPSEEQKSVPTVSRLIGTVGLFALTIGVVSIVAHQYGRGLLGEELGSLMAALGLTGLFIHAARDNDVEVRRLYGLFATILLVLALFLSLVPGPFASGSERHLGHYMMPWGAVAGLLALVFAVPFARHETEEPYATYVRFALLGIGLLLTFGSVAAGVVAKQTLLGPGLLMAILGLGYISAYLANSDTSDGPGYTAAGALGTIGGVAVILAFGQSVVPTVLHEGPSALKTPMQNYDFWKVMARVFSIVVALGFAGLGIFGRVPSWLRGGLVVLGLAAAGVFLIGSFTTVLLNPPATYFVPYGLLLAGVGLLYLIVAIAATSDMQLVVQTRRELATYFYSPIAYIVFFVTAFSLGIGYAFFIVILPNAGGVEPILQDYLPGSFVGPLLIPFLVPALTMRLLSEERRTGTLEVLLTAPISEATVVISKFLACWMFFMLCWVPAGLYLIGLRVEGGSPFDYRPLLSFYVAVGVSGMAFISVGMFFSSLTQNQIVAAVLTFMVMLALMMAQWVELIERIGPTVQQAIRKFAYWPLWNQALQGQLSVTDILLQASAAAFGVFLTVRVLEARKWS